MLTSRRQAEDQRIKENQDQRMKENQQNSGRTNTNHTKPSPMMPDPQGKPQQSTHLLPQDIYSQHVSQQEIHQHSIP